MRASAEERHEHQLWRSVAVATFKYSKFPKYCLLDTKRINCGSDPMVRPSKKTSSVVVLLVMYFGAFIVLSFKIILSLSQRSATVLPRLEHYMRNSLV